MERIKAFGHTVDIIDEKTYIICDHNHNEYEVVFDGIGGISLINQNIEAIKLSDITQVVSYEIQMDEGLILHKITLKNEGDIAMWLNGMGKVSRVSAKNVRFHINHPRVLELEAVSV